MTVSQLIRDLSEMPPLARIFVEEQSLFVGKNRIIRLDKKVRKISAFDRLHAQRVASEYKNNT
jgi:hypothetical protein